MGRVNLEFSNGFLEKLKAIDLPLIYLYHS